ncbi:MAG: hypothetical protein HOP29_11405 [Phycisphaerales bacterium]|nr:hypothetical protein [Phycisphaerales bacterium]
MSSRTLSTAPVVFITACLLVSSLACDGTTDISAFFGLSSDNTPDDASSQPIPDDDSVTIELVNASPLAVDVELFLTTDPAITFPELLFQEPNAYRDGIGFLSLGILDIGESVDISLDCPDALFVGTTGGQYLDPASGDVLTLGAKQRWAQLGPQFDCGDTVTFEFYFIDSDEPDVSLQIP